MHRFAGYGQTTLYFGTDWYKLNKLPQCLDDESIPFVATIVTNILAQKASTYAQPYFIFHALRFL